MARSFTQGRPLRQAGFLWRKFQQSPPFLIALVLHVAVLTILGNITVSSEMPDQLLTVDVSKVLPQKIERPPDEVVQTIIKATDKDVKIEDPDQVFAAPQEALDNKPIGDMNLIAGTGPGIVAPVRVGGMGRGGSFGDTVMKYRRAGLDVVFVVDTTWTLQKFIDQFKLQINNMITVLDKLVGARCRIGIVCYRDKAGTVKIKSAEEKGVKEFYHTKTIALTNDRQKLREFVQAMGVGPGPKTEQEAKDYAAGKGIPAEEDVCEGLRLAVEMPWEEGAIKVIVLMGDAQPHAEDMTKLQGLIAKFKSGSKAAIHCIYSEPPMELSGLYGKAKEQAIADQKKDIERVYEIFRDIARRGGGDAVSIDKAKEVVRQLLVFALGPMFKKNVDEVYAELGIGAAQKAEATEEKKEGAEGEEKKEQ